MAKAIDILKDEHRVIEKVLDSLERFAGRVEAGSKNQRETLGDFVKFFQDFADQCHHGKEEDILFRKMVVGGFPSEYGPIAVMLQEHGESRNHMGALAALAQGPTDLTSEERQSLSSHSREFVALLRDHILKEDLVLYPMALDTLRESVIEGLVKEFEGFEAREMPPDRHERLQALANHLIETFPPEPAKGPGTSKFSGCCGL